jgi:DNA-binding transcriptional LysR family regulator
MASQGDTRIGGGIDLRLLEYFLAVVDHGGITRAAQALYLAQPSMSQAIRTLERQLGTELFDRSGGRLTLTSHGRSLEVRARLVRADVARARAAVRSVRDLETGRLAIATMPPLDMDPLPELASRMRRTHPGIVLYVTASADQPDVADEVRRGRVELGLVVLPVTAGALCVLPLEIQEIALVLPPHLATGLPDPTPLDALVGLPMVRIGGGRGRMPDTPGRVVVECAHGAALGELVRQGAGATFLPRRLAEQQMPGVVVRSTVPAIERPIGVLHRPGRLAPAAAAFLELAGLVPADQVNERPAGDRERALVIDEPEGPSDAR